MEEPDNQKIMPTPHKDYIWIIQEIIPGGDAQTIYTQAGAGASQFYVKGKYQPNLYMNLNEVQRWRFITRDWNATRTRSNRAPRCK